MALSAGTRLGPYEIVSPLGAGGMGEVYRARDTRLEREVAVKVLPAALSADAGLRQRLEREAKAISKLSHPHICTLHDIGRHDGIDFLVMELLDGETLEHRLLRGPLPPDQTIRYAAQIADALGKAHKLGFTHRDLKPANIMLTKSGATLMDFGLAKQSSSAPLAQALTEMTLEQSKLTGEGSIVGTFQYMAPEQLEGKEADARTDIFALGEVIYEMATAKPAFAGKSRASLIAAILTTEPPAISQLRPMTPPALERLVKKCLAKDPDDRWQSASDLASELLWIQESGSQSHAAVAIPAARTVRGLLPWLVAGLAVAAVLALIYFRAPAEPHTVIRSLLLPEEGTTPILTGDFAGPMMLAPDGHAVVFLAARETGAPMLWVRDLNALHARVLAGTEGAIFPFWSPDSRAIGFFAGGKLKTISVDGGMPAEICDAPGGRGGSWGSGGTIIFAPQFQSGLSQVSAAGGTPTPLTAIEPSRHDSHRWPQFLPDGKHFLYLALSHVNPRDANDGIYFASLDGKQNKLVMHGFTNAVYAAGRLLFAHDTSLMAQPFDPESGVLSGQPEQLADNLRVDGNIWRAAFDAAGPSLLTYATGGLVPAQAVWYDRSGKELGPAGDKQVNLNSLRLSPDGTRLATDAGEFNGDVWVSDLSRKVNTRLTFGPGASNTPVWSPDGRWIAFAGTRGPNGIYRKLSNGSGEEEALLKGDGQNRVPLDWSSDGKYLLVGVGDFASTGQVWMLPLSGEPNPVLLTDKKYVTFTARFSPDGRWLAYASNESGRSEVYVTAFGSGSGKWQISGSGGSQPIWRRDGKELFYWSLDNTVISVPIHLDPSGVQAGSAHALFRPRNLAGNVGLTSPYDVTNDGQRFVIISLPEQTATPITLVTNWTSELKSK